MNLRLPVTTDISNGIFTITRDCHGRSFPGADRFLQIVIGTEVESYV
jgi:hypothetical protein